MASGSSDGAPPGMAASLPFRYPKCIYLSMCVCVCVFVDMLVSMVLMGMIERRNLMHMHAIYICLHGCMRNKKQKGQSRHQNHIRNSRKRERPWNTCDGGQREEGRRNNDIFESTHGP